jgi:hypothetical protein
MPILDGQPFVQGLEQDAESLTVLRLVFMNRWVENEEADGQNYMEDFLDHLQKEVQKWGG